MKVGRGNEILTSYLYFRTLSLMPKKLLQLVILSILIVLLMALFVQKISKSTRDPSISSSSLTNIFTPKETPTPTPFPLAELTIPSLRARTDQSKLEELKPYQQKPDYSSYLTSYDSDSLQINGLLTIPKGSQPEGGWPAIIFVHGYIPPNQYQTTEKYIDYVDYLARNGFVVLKIDLRGHGQSDGEPGGAYYSADYVIDTLNAYSALQNADFVNRGRIGLWGHSMAGNITFRSFVVSQKIPALVIWAGAGYSYQDLQTYGLSDNSYQRPESNSGHQRGREQLRELYGNFNIESEFWKQVVPINYLFEVSGAIQLHHAVNDDTVNIGYSRDLMTILDQTSISHELYEYPSGGHNISGRSFTVAMQRTVEFFQKELN